MSLKTAQYKHLLPNVRALGEPAYQLFKALTDDFDTINRELYPQLAAIQTDLGAVTGIIVPDGITGFAVTYLGTSIKLSWSAALNAANYEIRLGADWDTGVFVDRTQSLQAYLNPLTSGSYTYWIKAYSSSAEYSENAVSVVATITAPEAPVLSTQVIDNNVLLSWSVPSSIFNIQYYEVYRDTTKIGETNGTFSSVFETTAGTYTYKVRAIDIAGNIGTFGTISAVVNQPPDFELKDQRLSDLSGTVTNGILDVDQILFCIDLATDYKHHFTDNSWAGPSAQVTAGFPNWITPSETTGKYEEEIDYGTLISNTIINIDYSVVPVTGTVTLAPRIRSSVDGSTWSSWSTGRSHFATSFRYVQIEVGFSSDNNSLVWFSNLIIRIDVKREVDSGEINALASDATGTVVTFNKTFKDVDSITLEAKSVIPGSAMVDFTDIPDPASFKVYVFDSTGNRMNALVYWKARGIV